MNRRTALAILASLAVAPLAHAQQNASPPDRLRTTLDAAEKLQSLETVLVSRDGDMLAERAFRGKSVSRATNIKSASKSIISALVGIAIDKKLLKGVDQPIVEILKSDLPRDADPRLATVTIGNLLSMQAGLSRMSGPNYGRWVSSGNWVRTALAAPFDNDPGTGMLYSTASTHLLSAILTRVGKKSTLALARDWLGPLDGFSISAWERDPQGIHLGGNQMAMTPRSLLAFGELYRRGGVTTNGMRLVSKAWIDQSWQVRTHSVFNGDGYGYGWFLSEMAGERVHYGWGYGGQMLYIVPSLGLTVVMTSDDSAPSARSGYRDQLHALLAEIILAVKAES
jgi:CubicO group peptidase (beta-lactamase class C family)